MLLKSLVSVKDRKIDDFGSFGVLGGVAYYDLLTSLDMLIIVSGRYLSTTLIASLKNIMLCRCTTHNRSY